MSLKLYLRKREMLKLRHDLCSSGSTWMKSRYRRLHRTEQELLLARRLEHELEGRQKSRFPKTRVEDRSARLFPHKVFKLALLLLILYTRAFLSEGLAALASIALQKGTTRSYENMVKDSGADRIPQSKYRQVYL